MTTDACFMRLKAISKSVLFSVMTILLLSMSQWVLQEILNRCCRSNGVGLILNALYLGNPMCLGINKLQYTISERFVFICATITSSAVGWVMARLAVG